MLSSAVSSDRCKSENAYSAVPVQMICNSVFLKLTASYYTSTTLALFFCDSLFMCLFQKPCKAGKD